MADEKKDEEKAAKPPVKKAVTIKYGDVMVSVEGESQEDAKKDAMEIFGLLEEKYAKHWTGKTCTEKTRYD